MLNTGIQWCDSTVNPVMGCSGCELWNEEIKSCYSGNGHERRKGHPGYAPTFERPTLFPGRMARAARWSDLGGMRRPGKPWLDGLLRLIFVSDMGDAMSAPISFEYLEEQIIQVVTSPDGLRHEWLWLTKRPDRMAHFSRWLADHGVPWPTNLWAGTSITSASTLARVGALRRVGDESTTRFLSVEPLTEFIDLTDYLAGLAGSSLAVSRGAMRDPSTWIGHVLCANSARPQACHFS